jgi:hypothetical protein
MQHSVCYTAEKEPFQVGQSPGTHNDQLTFLYIVPNFLAGGKIQNPSPGCYSMRKLESAATNNSPHPVINIKPPRGVTKPKG